MNNGPTHPTILPRVATDCTADTQRRVHRADNRLGYLILRRRAPCGRPQRVRELQRNVHKNEIKTIQDDQPNDR